MAGRSSLIDLLLGIRGLKRGLLCCSLISLILNILQLALPIYSMQIYDRVLPSGSRATLLALTLLVGGLLVAGFFLDGLRGQILIRLGNRIDGHVRHRLLEAALAPGARPRAAAHGPLRDLDLLRGFLAGPIAPALLDLPWAGLFVLATFALDPILGIITVVGALLVLVTALAGEIRAARWTRAAQERSAELGMRLESALACRESLRAMGTVGATRERLLDVSWAALESSMEAADRTAWSAASARGLRSLLQVVLLLGSATLAMANEIPMGAIVASTMLFSRALLPIDRIASSWRALLAVRESAAGIARVLIAPPSSGRRLSLAPVQGRLEVDGVCLWAEGRTNHPLETISFACAAGSVLVVLGASGSGKSTLARLLVGALRPTSGTIRLDGAALEDWDEVELGRQVGYLPQEPEWQAGTVAEVIARGGPVDDQRVTKAAGRVGAHEMILRLPNGYQTVLGRSGAALSAGQRRIIAFARACYGDPAFLVLDDPTASLDDVGERIVAKAVAELRALGSTVVIVTRQTHLVRGADFVLMLQGGRKKLFENARDVLRVLERPDGVSSRAAVGHRA